MIKNIARNIFHQLIEIIILLKFKTINIKSNKLDDKNKILIVAHDFNKAGAQVLLLNIVKELSKRQNDIIVIGRDYGNLKSEFKKYVPTYIAKCTGIFNLYIKALNNKGYKVAITNTVVTGDVILAIKKNGFNVISLIHELPMLIKSGGFINSAENIAKKSDIVIFPSSYVEKKFQEIAQVTNRVIVKPQGLYLNQNHIVDKVSAKKEINRIYNIPINKEIVINVASGIERKGFDLFLEIAIKSIEEKDIWFIWVGDYKSDIYEKVIKKYNLNKIPNLTLTGYIDDSKELVKFYDAAEVLMLTSREEPFGSIVLEAFNSKTPVLAFEDSGGFVDTVIENETGYLVEYENIDIMKQKLIEAIKRKDILESLGEKGKSSLVNYNFNTYITMIEDLTKSF